MLEQPTEIEVVAFRKGSLSRIARSLVDLRVERNPMIFDLVIGPSCERQRMDLANNKLQWAFCGRRTRRTRRQDPKHLVNNHAKINLSARVHEQTN